MSKPQKRRKKRKCKDFPNDWLYYKKLKPKHFGTCTYQELIDGLVNVWDLPSSVQLIARAQHIKTGCIEEHSFASAKDVRKFFSVIRQSGEPYHVYCFDNHQQFTAIFND